MKWLTDSELLEELNKRFKENKKVIDALNVMNRKLESLNEKLQESEQLKSNFLSNIKNEINNPLTSILCVSKELVSVKSTDKETVSSLANMIHSEAFNLDSQLRNIFAAAEFEAGEATLCISKVNIDTLMSSSIESLEHKAEKKAIKVQYTPINGPESDQYFNTDPNKLSLIIFNLLENAIEYSNKGSHVELMVWKHESHLYISMKDSGSGIDKSDQDRIFDRFRQLDSGVTKSHLGHGLGLSIVKATIDLLNGTISLESENGKGCIFTISIPEEENEAEFDIISENSNEFIFEEAEEF